MPKKGEKLSEGQKAKMAAGRKRVQQGTRAERPHVDDTPAERSGRRERVAFGVPRSKLTVRHVPPGYHLHWTNDVGNRLNDALFGDYEFVTEAEVGAIGDKNLVPGNQDLGDRVSKSVGKQDNGLPLIAYLMKIPIELYKQDQADKQTQIDESEQAMLRGEQTGDEHVENSYVPSEGIHMNTSNH